MKRYTPRWKYKIDKIWNEYTSMFSDKTDINEAFRSLEMEFTYFSRRNPDVFDFDLIMKE